MIEAWKERRKRRKYVRAMFKAIEAARRPGRLFRNADRGSVADGLRVIKDFERVNEIKFDPFDSYHVDKISGMATHKNFFRRARQILE